MTVLWHECSVGEQCPKIHTYTGGRVIAQGDDLRQVDPAKAAELGIPAHETAAILPATAIQPGYVEDLATWIRERFTNTLVRIENRPAYEVASDGGDFARWLDGAPAPTVGAEWMDQLRAERAAGKQRTKVHITGHTAATLLTDYEQYAFDWGFRRTVDAGENVLVLDDTAPRLYGDVPDFSVIDGRHVLRMDYGDDHRFVGALPITGPDAAVYRALARHLMVGATAFHTWMAAHPAAVARPPRAA